MTGGSGWSCSRSGARGRGPARGPVHGRGRAPAPVLLQHKTRAAEEVAAAAGEGCRSSVEAGQGGGGVGARGAGGAAGGDSVGLSRRRKLRSHLNSCHRSCLVHSETKDSSSGTRDFHWRKDPDLE